MININDSVQSSTITSPSSMQFDDVMLSVPGVAVRLLKGLPRMTTRLENLLQNDAHHQRITLVYDDLAYMLLINRQKYWMDPG